MTNIKDNLLKKIDKLYPPVFIDEYEYGKARMERGKRELTCIRRLSAKEKQVLDDILSLVGGNYGINKP
jgi:hypothetical protein